MATPTGTIGMSDVNIELGKASNALITLNDADVRALAGKPTGTISMDDLRGKSKPLEWVVGGAVGFTNTNYLSTDGTYWITAGTTNVRRCNNASTWTAGGALVSAANPTDQRASVSGVGRQMQGISSQTVTTTNGGASWTSIRNINSQSVYSCDGNSTGRFVLCVTNALGFGTSGQIMTSLNGSAPTTLLDTGAATNQWCVRWNEASGLFLITGGGGTTTGSTWTTDGTSAPVARANLGARCIGLGAGEAGTWCASTRNNTGVVHRTINSGASWSTINLPTTVSVRDIAYGDGKFVAMCGPATTNGGTTYESNDNGATWTEVPVPGSTGVMRGLAYNPSLGKWGMVDSQARSWFST